MAEKIEGVDEELRKTRTEIEVAKQLCFAPVRDVVNMIRTKMINDGVPRTDDGIARACIGLAISIAKNLDITDPNFVKQIVDEMWPQILLAAPKIEIVREVPEELKQKH